MKTRIRPFQLLCLSMLLMSFLWVSCSDDDKEPEPTQNIVELAQGNSDLSTLVAALSRFPDIVSSLSDGQFTVLAPTNNAFDDLLEAVGQTSLDDIPDEVLRSILTYHVIANATLTSDALTNTTVATLSGEDLEVNVDGGVTFNGSSNVINADVDATNGVVHVIDAVLVNPSIQPIVGTVVAPAYFNNNFTTLIAAVQAASPSILTTLLNSDNKTLFAPTNDAFAAAGITSLPDQSTLDDVLTYHVISGIVNSADIADGSSSANTLNGEIYLSKNASGVFINGLTQVTTPDIAASNGVVHVIDRTLMPPSQTIAGIAVEASQAENPEFTQLVAALSKVPDLLNAADSDGDLTVFAPTDAAFESLYTALEVENIDELEQKIGNDKLAEVLQHHIVGARVFSTDLVSGNVGTLNQEVSIDVNTLTIEDANGSNPPAGLVTSMLNILATNGVIHVIDKVLIPQGII